MQVGTRNTTVPRWVVLVWELAIAALIVDIVVSSWNVNSLASNQQRAKQTRERQMLLQELMSTIKDAETGQRGFVLTGKEEFLDPYKIATARVWPLFGQLRDFAQGDTIQLERLAELEIYLDQKLQLMAEGVALFRARGEVESRDLAKQQQGKQAMDRIRGLIDEMSRHEDGHLARQDWDAQFSFHVALGTALGGGALTVAMIVFAFVLVRQELQRRTAVEAELRASETSFRVLAEVMPQMVWVTDPRGNHTYYNPRWYEYTGLSQAESHGQGWSNPLHPDDRDRAQVRWQQALDTGEPYQIEYRFRAADGNYRWFLGLAYPQRDVRGGIVRWIGTCTDIDDAKRQEAILEEQVSNRTAQLMDVNAALLQEIAERSRAEQSVQALLAEVQRSNEHLEQFAYVASHDLQEPLRKIQAFGDLLQRKYQGQLDEQGVAYIDRLIASATRMRKLIDDLLTYSRVSTRSRAMEQVNLNQVVDGVLNDLENQIARTGGAVQVGDLPTLQADQSQMRQLFQNLIGNALKFHHPNRPPQVTVEAESLTNVKDRCRILIRDNGIGFDEVYLDRIFEMFQRLHGRGDYPGTGMGLAICRKIVERQGGSITARSKVGEGTCFIVELPLHSSSTNGGQFS